MSTPKENDLTKKEDAQLVSCSSSDDEKEQWTEYCGEYPCYIGIGSCECIVCDVGACWTVAVVNC